MPHLPARARRAAVFTTTSVVSFSLTLLGGSIAILTNLVPLGTLTLGQRVDLGAMLFVAPVLALVLGILLEATRVALSQDGPAAEPHRRQVVRHWQPGRREG